MLAAGQVIVDDLNLEAAVDRALKAGDEQRAAVNRNIAA